jgi:signal transduction histidine kinase
LRSSSFTSPKASASTEPEKASRLPLVVTGALSAVLGAVVVLGWHLGLDAVVRVVPGFNPMMYNAALAFAVCGLGMLAAASGRSLISTFCGALTAAIGLLTLIEYAFHVDLGIDQALMTAYLPQGGPYPGRIILNTTVGLVLLGIALILLSRRAWQRRPVVFGLLGSGVAALGLAPLTGLALGLGMTFGWGSYIPVALNAAIALTITGLGLIWFAWQRGKTVETHTPRWFPLLIFVAGVTISGVLYQAFSAQESTYIERTVQSQADSLLQHMAVNVEQRARALDRLGLHWENYGYPSRTDWEFDATVAFDYAILRASAWVDPSLHVRWVAPRERNEVYQDFDLGAHQTVRKLLEAAGSKRSLTLTHRVTLPSGEPGFLMVRPIFPKNRFAGFLIGFSRLDALAAAAIRPAGENQCALTVTIGGEAAYDHRPENIVFDDNWSRQSSMRLYGNQWTVRVSPARTIITRLSTRLPRLFLTGELLLSFLLALVVFLFQTSQLRGAQLATAVRDLQWEVAERKRAEDALRQHAQDLARSNAELEQFAYVASHDLQEPLRMVASYTQLLARRYGGELDADAHDFIDYAVDGARRMQALINDLLTYSRVGTRGKEFAPTDLEKVFDATLSNLASSIDENRATVTHDPLPTVIADDSQMVQLFQNLIANAIKFHGAEAPRVHVSARRQVSKWAFSVSDNGIGIEPAHRERIFVIFQRLHGKSEYPGTGIGLAICKKIVERHGGRIWVESEPGKGSTFCFTLPA